MRAPAADWLDCRDAQGRLDDANGFVRMELASAQRRDIPAIPVLESMIGGLLIERVSRQGAAYVEPISDVLVKRAAKKASTLEGFYGMLVGEIGAETDRVKFLRSCRTQY